MVTHDMSALQNTIDTLKEELSQSLIQAEVFRALYTRQAAEIEQLQARLGDAERAPAGRRLHVNPPPAARRTIPALPSPAASRTRSHRRSS